jgi:ketosteroid isomerase-like protein
MPREAAEVVRRILDAFPRRDLDAILELFHEEAEIHPGIAGAVEGVVYRGPDGTRDWLRHIDDGWRQFSFEIDETRDIGQGRVLTLGHFHAVGRESGVPVDQPYGGLFTVKNGKVTAYWGFRSQQDALEAAGLSE